MKLLTRFSNPFDHLWVLLLASWNVVVKLQVSILTIQAKAKLRHYATLHEILARSSHSILLQKYFKGQLNWRSKRPKIARWRFRNHCPILLLWSDFLLPKYFQISIFSWKITLNQAESKLYVSLYKRHLPIYAILL